MEETIDVEANNNPRFVMLTCVLSSRADLSDPVGRTRDESGQPFAASDKTASRANSRGLQWNSCIVYRQPICAELYTEYYVYEAPYVVMPYFE